MASRLNLTIIAIAALVSVLALVALVFMGAETRLAAGTQLVEADQNLVGYDVCTVVNPAGCSGARPAATRYQYS